MYFDGKIAIVTGAGSGIGKGTALHLAKLGATVVAVGRSLEPLEELVATISEGGTRALAIAADVSDEADMQAAFDQVQEQFGRLDILFANAGINGTWTPIEDMSPADWDEVMAVNLRGTFLSVHRAIPLMRKAGGGAIVINSSINGTRTFTLPGTSAYCATKAGQVAFTKSAALELARYRIRVNAICPGRIESNIHDNPKPGTEKIAIRIEYPDGDIPLTGGVSGKPEDVAEVVAFLASDASRHVTGSVIFVDGAQSLMI
ncbi:3-oxoacyl-ACP reductase FabG [Pelagibacterium limicola]|uniref:3-oxoacyl-ACP reductase FabG n=1 Tax=Pelagibacterium limicola TaxID=2791022 RepID=UPI0018AF6156